MKSRFSGGQPQASSVGNIDEEKQTDLLSRLYELAWEADVKKSVPAQREIEELCREHRFLARERARMVKETQEAQVAVARRARRGEPLVPIKVIKANGRVRQFGPRLPSGRAPRRACNARTRGSRRAAGIRSGQDPGGEPPESDLNRVSGVRW